MEQITVKAKKWGNSLGIILPSVLVERERINEGTDLVIQVMPQRGMTGGDLMVLSKKLGLDKKLKKLDTQKAMREIDKEFWSE